MTAFVSELGSEPTWIARVPKEYCDMVGELVCVKIRTRDLPLYMHGPLSTPFSMGGILIQPLVFPPAAYQ